MEEPTQEQLIQYDIETQKHIKHVRVLVSKIIDALYKRGAAHDRSKREDPERSAYAVIIPKLAGLKYGTPEHKAVLGQMKVAIEHHYKNNSHHPEHHESIDKMDLIDILEMLCDWKAASIRSSQDFRESLEISLKRFGFDSHLAALMRNTAELIDDYNPSDT